MNIQVPQEQIADFCRRWKITELAVFGSVLREDFRADGDVDLLATFAPDAVHSLFHHVEMEIELKEMLGRDVDLVSKSAVTNPFRRHHILNHHQVVYAA